MQKEWLGSNSFFLKYILRLFSISDIDADACADSNVVGDADVHSTVKSNADSNVDADADSNVDTDADGAFWAG